MKKYLLLLLLINSAKLFSQNVGIGTNTPDTSAALELGYFSGNMHWAVRFEGVWLRIALQGPAQRYIERLEPFLADGRVRQVGDA